MFSENQHNNSLQNDMNKLLVINNKDTDNNYNQHECVSTRTTTTTTVPIHLTRGKLNFNIKQSIIYLNPNNEVDSGVQLDLDTNDSQSIALSSFRLNTCKNSTKILIDKQEEHSKSTLNTPIITLYINNCKLDVSNSSEMLNTIETAQDTSIERKASNTSTTSSDVYSELSDCSSNGKRYHLNFTEIQKSNNNYLQIPQTTTVIKNWIETTKNQNIAHQSKSAPNFFLEDCDVHIQHTNNKPRYSTPNETNTTTNTIASTKDLCGLIEETKIIDTSNCQKSKSELSVRIKTPTTPPDKCSSYTLLVRSTQTSISCDLIENTNNINSHNCDQVCSICNNRLSHCPTYSVASLPDYCFFNNPIMTKTSSGCDIVQTYFTNALNNDTSTTIEQKKQTTESTPQQQTQQTHDIRYKLPKYTTKLTSRLSKLLNFSTILPNEMSTTIGGESNSMSSSVQENNSYCYYSVAEDGGHPASQHKNLSNKYINENRFMKALKKSSKSTGELDDINQSKYCTQQQQLRKRNRFFNESNATFDATYDNSSSRNLKIRSKYIAKDLKSKASNLLKRRHTDTSCVDKSILPSREDVIKWQTSFEQLLRHKYGVALFGEFLKTEFSAENIEFWLACEDYKTTEKEQKLAAKARKILVDFVQIGAQKEVNLDIELRKLTETKTENPTIDTFERAQKRIQILMEKDSYPRFLESELYKDLCKVVNSNSNSHIS